MTTSTYNRFLLGVAGLGGLLYGIDVGIIAGALPYLTATSGFSPAQLSIVVAAVLLGSVLSTLFAGLLADLIGRKWLMTLTAFMFCLSVPIIALSHGFGALVAGRLLQGMSAGLIGVVVPLYLAECVDAKDRGKSTGLFQFFLVFGFVVSSLITLMFSAQLAPIVAAGNAAAIFAFKDHAWRNTFWLSLPFGLLFTIGSFWLAESPRWLFRRGMTDGALAALRRSRSEDQAQVELREMQETAALKSATSNVRDSLLRRKYVIPFVIACIILTCQQLTGINSIIPYFTTTLLQAGLNDYNAHVANLIFTFVNFGLTFVGMLLVDRVGRKVLLTVGTAGIILSLICTGLLFHQTEAKHVDVTAAVTPLVKADQTMSIAFNQATAANMLKSVGASSDGATQSFIINYAYGAFSNVTNVVHSDDPNATVTVNRDFIPPTRIEALLGGSSSPFGDLDAARAAPLRVISAYITPVPGPSNGWLVALTIYAFMAFYAVGPGVCVWLALSELMPTRIRSNGMSIALTLNQATSTTIAGIFLPTVAVHGYAMMFFTFAGCTLIYFFTATFWLPETKGKTLEEIEEVFEH